MNDATTLFVPGAPVPQGSKTIGRAGGRVWLRDANAGTLRPWRDKVALHADIGATYDVPVAVTLRFVLEAPKRPRWPVPAVKPDIDKLSRAILDGLTDGGLLENDSRVVRLVAVKEYGAPVGVHITVEET